MTRPWSPYPWQTLERVPRATQRAARSSARALRRLLDPTRIAGALAELTESDVSLHVKSLSAHARPDELAARLALSLDEHARAELHFAPELAVELLTRALRRPFRLSAPTALEDALAGALAALAVEVARRAGCENPRLAALAPPSNATLSELSLVVGGKPYLVLASLTAGAEPKPAPRLAELAELEISVPVVAALALAERASLGDFLPGNAWFPGAGWWLDAGGKGSVALAAPSAERGVRAELTERGDLVLRGEVTLSADAGGSMSDSDTTKPLTQAVLDSPVVVRIEIGAVSMTAREWSELAPGDIIEAGRRVAEPVVLRVAGREVARGELVNLEGELGVRIRELVRS